jgi:hypothetical protein
MIWTIVVIAFCIHMVFGDYIKAQAAYLQEKARALELENDEKEFK